MRSKCASRYFDIIEGALTFLLEEKMNEFLLLNKIKALNMYTEQYIFSSFPKKDLALKIRLEENLYSLLEFTIKANVNEGNIRSKYQTELLSCIYLWIIILG